MLVHPERPDELNFPLDPLKAGDAHIRKFDDRFAGGSRRNYWTYTYNKNVTDYVSDPNRLMDPAFTSRFSGPNEQFLPHDVRYFNWRLVLRNGMRRGGAASPAIDSLAVNYRIEPAR